MSKKKDKTPTGIYARGNRLWCRLKDETGKWVSKSTGYAVGEEAEAERYRKAAQSALDARRERGDDAPLTVGAYAERWIDERAELGVRSADDEATRLRKHALPHLGSIMLDELRPRHVRDMVRALRKAGDLAPRTIRNVYGVVHTMMEHAVVDELVAANPCKLKRGELPKARDKDPEWRRGAVFTRDEVEALISSEKLLPDRRVVYALKALAGLRHGEVAALRWRHWDRATEPLGQLTIAASYNSRTRTETATKTDTVRYVPAHPTLAAILAEWKLSGWQSLYGRRPGPDDLVVPTRKLNNRNASDAQKAFREDLDKLGLRKRRGHDLRRTFVTLARRDGADPNKLRVVTHPPSQDMLALYTSFPWASICEEVAKLKVARLGGGVVELATAFATADVSGWNGSEKVATPTFLDVSWASFSL